MAYNFINMEDKCLSKFVITSICMMTAILMIIITDSVYIFNVVAQTNENDIETNRIIDRQRTPLSSGENPTDDVGNALIMPSRIINNVGGVAIDKFANIFIVDNGIISF